MHTFALLGVHVLVTVVTVQNPFESRGAYAVVLG